VSGGVRISDEKSEKGLLPKKRRRVVAFSAQFATAFLSMMKKKKKEKRRRKQRQKEVRRLLWRSRTRLRRMTAASVCLNW
jgi:hypothetical protein